ncbi:hypothetical protein DS2_16589 [Catenovulum agarivorans DS-2]|uniref:DUF3466 family protein n=1 Tax=Catenovulum agarivorans DS-2 TaxID=1328313 RepID=W7QI50_9ALTE|nr:DUF3466 family protein [Catenovulum agarivorans]EWH08582.1 hypothetical protein DS2_16589 [Catenovulum agarivorans DS-2]
MMNKLTKLSIALLTASASFATFASALSYNLETISTAEVFKNSFPIDINDNNEAVSLNTGIYQHPVDLSLLDFDERDLTFANQLAQVGVNNVSYLESVKKGNFDATSLQSVLGYISGNASDGRYQPIANYRSSLAEYNQSEELVVFDTINPNTDELSYFNNEYARGINNLSWIVGDTSSTFTRTEFNDETWLIPNFIHRGFVKTRNRVIELLPPYDEIVGGVSYATEISNSGWVVGYGSIEATNNVLSIEASCEQNDLIPEQVCLWQGFNNNIANQTSFFKTHALMWKVNANGEVSQPIDLGIAIDDSGSTNQAVYSSRAFAVNEEGYAVGDSHVRDVNDDVRRQAALFHNGSVHIITNPLTYPASRATDINDNNIVIGVMSDTAGLGIVQKSFYYDLNTSDTQVQKLDDFAVSSQTLARAINNQNVIVGQTEIDALTGGSTPKHGFVYYTDTDEMFDLNELMTCDTNMTIVDAVAINNDGVILAHASATQTATNIMNQQLVDGLSGEFAREQVNHTVKLVPDAQGMYDCVLPGDDIKIKRKGASFSWIYLSLLFITFLFKKSIRNRKSI